MDLGVNRNHLYAARQLTVSFTDPSGKPEGGSGTGFIVNYHDTMFVVTNRHVVDPAYSDPGKVGWKLHSLSVAGYDTCSVHGEMIERSEWELLAPEPTHWQLDDVAVFPFANVVAEEFTYLDNVRKLSQCHGLFGCYYDSNALSATGDFGSTNKPVGAATPRGGQQKVTSIDVMDVVAVCGFPAFSKFVSDRPVAMVGFIASDPRFTPAGLEAWRPEGGTTELRSDRVVLYQGLSRQGQSGSPVLATQRGIRVEGMAGSPWRPQRLVGISAGHIAGSNNAPSMFSYFIRSDSILAALGEASNKMASP